MRPISKGIAPNVYSKYGDAKDDLREALGSYCSYCEMNISNGMDIEHVSPKSKNKDLSTDWDNLLIACKVCNRIKSHHNQNRDGYIFPDTHNTAYAYKYEKNKVIVNESLSSDEQVLAQNTLDLVGINRVEDSTKRKDDRYVARLREWEKAEDSLTDFITNDSPEMIRQIGRSPSGFISSWLSIFNSYTEVKRELLSNTLGTDISCYDSNFNVKQGLEK